MIRRVAVIGVVLVLLAAFCRWQNNGLMVTEYEYILPEGHEELDGVRIAQISDLHSKLFDGGLEELLERVRPDVVVLTGDLVDRRDKDFTDGVSLARAAAQMAPTYFAPGNHEASHERKGTYKGLSSALEQAGVTVLENRSQLLELEEGVLRLTGVLDPGFYDANMEGAKLLLADELARQTDGEVLDVVLCHRPTLLEACAAGGADLVFSGHAHGGQVRLPFIGGVIAPDEGFLPEYTCGLYQKKDTTMVVSRGLGNSIAPLRLFNRPELVVVTLREE